MTIEFRTHSTVELDNHMSDDLDVIRAARVSTQGVNLIDEARRQGIAATDPDRFISFLMRDRHGTPFEHCTLRFFIETPIFVIREWRTHRISSFNEESARYKVLAPRFYVPPRARPTMQIGKATSYELVDGGDELHEVVASTIMQNSTESYRRYEALLASGAAREVARQVLPVNVFTSFFWTINARSLLNFLSLRSTATAERYFPTHPLWEIDRAAQQVEEYFADLMPVTWRAFNKHGRVAP
ncbi:thymidylate synthase (FAD) [Actinoplanes campanulatus]|uniref:Flavin-dependent thymidylate synthase n=1 Tax=Actinoplanes campanulatus TaxID=113559 RepID=A0A7W5FI69_9ACTN|nr:FAD-dependent thymidylate synthase [Actinoplanes campanulatus]MBB3099369.1 thymidylate synthase (FAD) [Actinoplanes campanulatus]GGN40258.1 flavin-dependent thymidylate synthase [Actinoplanes campanulatus]GID42422.1 flavin-dependent thymidylate synthase [Actinoplanes campanulatus]